MGDAEVDTGGLKRTLKDLFAGAAGGIAQVLLGKSTKASLRLYPFSNSNYKRLQKCLEVFW